MATNARDPRPSPQAGTLSLMTVKTSIWICHDLVDSGTRPKLQSAVHRDGERGSWDSASRILFQKHFVRASPMFRMLESCRWARFFVCHRLCTAPRADLNTLTILNPLRFPPIPIRVMIANRSSLQQLIPGLNPDDRGAPPCTHGDSRP